MNNSRVLSGLHLVFASSLLLAATITAVGGLAPIAQAASSLTGGSTVQIGNGVLFEGCNRQAYSYAVDPQRAAGGWSLTVDAFDPRGIRQTGDIVGSFEEDPVSGTVAGIQICSFEMPGSWQLRATVDYYQGVDEELAPVAFRMRRPATTTSLQVNDRSAAVGQRLTFTARVLGEYPNGRFALEYAPVVLQKKVGSSWRAIGRASTDAAGRVRFSIRWPDRAARAVRAIATPSSPFAPGTSGAIIIR